MQLEILSCLEYDPENFDVQGHDAQSRTNFFFPTGTAL